MTIAHPGQSCVRVRITAEWHIALARSTLLRFIDPLPVSDTWQASVETSLSELAYNLFLHTSNGGLITIEMVSRGQLTGIRLISEDTGPGIASVLWAMKDGHSTNGGLGGGLPGIQRLMDEFNIQSEFGGGTLITTTKWL